MLTWRFIRLLVIAPLALPASAQPPAYPQQKPADAYRVFVMPPCASPDFPRWGQHQGGTEPIWLGVSPTPELALGDTAYLQLSPIEVVALATPLEKAPQPGDHGGLVTFVAPVRGTYRVALGSHGWIDVVGKGKPVASIAHKPGVACSGIAKMVDFVLKPGAYTIQLSAAADRTLRIAVAKLP